MGGQIRYAQTILQYKFFIPVLGFSLSEYSYSCMCLSLEPRLERYEQSARFVPAGGANCEGSLAVPHLHLLGE